MNQKWILFHLREGKEELDRMIADLDKDSDYDEENFRVAMGHLYHHLNTAWNGRNEPNERHRDCAQKDFDAWRKFPTNADVMLD